MRTTTKNSLPEIDAIGPNYGRIFVGADCWHYSYKTIIAYHGPRAPNGGIRRESNYSNTTARHFRELGSLNWERVSDDRFTELAGLPR